MSELLEKPILDTYLTADERRKLAPLRQQKFSHLNDDQWCYFIGLCREQKLSPWMKCLQAKKVSVPSGEDVVMVLPIEAYRVLAMRTKEYLGPTLGKHVFDDRGQLVSSTVSVYRQVCDQPREFPAIAMYAEYAPGALRAYRDTFTTQWLDKCAEALALRKGFPEQFLGVYAEDEFARLPLAKMPSKDAEAQAPWLDDVPEYRPPGE